MSGHEPEAPRTLGHHFRKALREANAWRPASFYTLLLIPVLLIVAAPGFYDRDDPWTFAMHLALLFAGLIMALLGAVFDAFAICRKCLRARRESFSHTLGEAEFLDELRARCHDREPSS